MENILSKTIANMYSEETEIHNSKYFAVLLFYTAGEINDTELPPHVYLCTNIVKFNNGEKALNYYANTPCPASQLIDAESEEELNIKCKEMCINMQNEDWLNENLFPYL